MSARSKKQNAQRNFGNASSEGAEKWTPKAKDVAGDSQPTPAYGSPRFPQTMLRLIKLPSRRQMRRIQQMLPNGTMGPIMIFCGKLLTPNTVQKGRQELPW